MQGAEFINDLCSNYLTVPYEGGDGDFALRMLTENITERFLPVEVRRLDGQALLFYNISGMQNMEAMYAEKTIDCENFRTLMWHLHEAVELSRELFLPGDGICLEPSVLFWNLETKHWMFVYIPGRNGSMIVDMQREREQFAEFLVMRIDYENNKLTEAVYRFYEDICAGRMYPEIFLEEEAESPGRKVSVRMEETGKTADMKYEEDWENKEEGERKEKTDKEGVSESGGVEVMLAVLFCAAAGVTFLLGRIVQNAVLPGAGVMVLSAALLFFVRIRKKRECDKKYGEEEDIIFTEEDTLWSGGTEEIKEEETEEKTVYMDITQEQEKRLYGIGKFRQLKISLDRLPCTVGKDKMLSDFIISDSSVSRMHARFFMEEKFLWMQDLNSTNGTYHNGLRLRPNEKVMMESEDEVGLGRVQFVFR